MRSVPGAQRRHLSVGVTLPVGTLVLLRLVELPVLVEIAAGTQRPEAQHCLGAAQTPARAGAGQPVFDQVATGAFDDLCELTFPLPRGRCGHHVVTDGEDSTHGTPPNPPAEVRARDRTPTAAV